MAQDIEFSTKKKAFHVQKQNYKVLSKNGSTGKNCRRKNFQYHACMIKGQHALILSTDPTPPSFPFSPLSVRTKTIFYQIADCWSPNRTAAILQEKIQTKNQNQKEKSNSTISDNQRWSTTLFHNTRHFLLQH